MRRRKLPRSRRSAIISSLTRFPSGRRSARRRARGGASCGIRINPERSTQEHAIYDPCAPGSRLGVKIADFRADLLDGIDGLHFHTLCEQGADALAATLEAVEEKFGKYLHGMKWLNFGGGHHITREGYDIPPAQAADPPCAGHL